MSNITTRIDENLKKQAEELFSQLGLNMTTAINIFLRQAVRQGGLPFDVKLDTPNTETLEAIKETDDIIKGKIKTKRYSNTEELFRDLDS